MSIGILGAGTQIDPRFCVIRSLSVSYTDLTIRAVSSAVAPLDVGDAGIICGASELCPLAHSHRSIAVVINWNLFSCGLLLYILWALALTDDIYLGVSSTSGQLQHAWVVVGLPIAATHQGEVLGAPLGTS